MLNIALKIGRNTALLLAGNLITAAVGFILAALLGRSLGDSGFGQYTLVMSWLLSLLIFSEFGLSTVLTRDLAAAPARTAAYLADALTAKLLLGLPAVLLLGPLAPQLATTSSSSELVPAYRWGILFLYSGLGYSTFTAVFKAHQTMTPILWTTLSGQLLLLAGTVLLLWLDRPLFEIVLWAGFSQSAQLGLAFLLYRRLDLGRATSGAGFDRVRIYRLLRRAWPFALAGFLAALQLRANLIVLAYLHSDQALGWYSAAGRFIDVGKQLPGAFYAAILPALAALIAAGPGQRVRLRQTFNRSRLGLLAFALLATGAAFLLAGPLVTLTYGPGYQPAVAVLKILALTLIPATQNSLLIVYLYAAGEERFVNWMIVLHTGLNLGLCFLLIPRWGAEGTAWAMLIAEIVVYWGYRWRSRAKLTIHNKRINRTQINAEKR